MKLTSRGKCFLSEAKLLAPLLDLLSYHIRRCLGFSHARNFELDPTKETGFICYEIVATINRQKLQKGKSYDVSLHNLRPPRVFSRTAEVGRLCPQFPSSTASRCLCILMIIGIAIAPVFWALAVGHAGFTYRKELIGHHADLIATKMAEKLQNQPPKA